MRTTRRWFRGAASGSAYVLAVGVAVTALMLGVAGPALAHVSLVETSPPDGARLTAFPAEVVLRFSQGISQPAYVIVTAPDGRSLARGTVRVDGSVLTLRTATSTAEGRYTIAYRVVSDDGHPISGQVTSAIGTDLGGPSGRETTGEPGSTAGAEAGAPTTTSGRPNTAERPTEVVGSNRTLVSGLVAVALFLLAGSLALWSRRYPPTG